MGHFPQASQSPLNKPATEPLSPLRTLTGSDYFFASIPSFLFFTVIHVLKELHLSNKDHHSIPSPIVSPSAQTAAQMQVAATVSSSSLPMTESLNLKKTLLFCFALACVIYITKKILQPITKVNIQLPKADKGKAHISASRFSLSVSRPYSQLLTWWA